MAYEFKKLSDVEVVAEPIEAANVLIEENGVIKKAPKTAVGGSGGGTSGGGATYDAILDFGEQSCHMEHDTEFDYSKMQIIGSSYNDLKSKLENGDYPKLRLRYNMVYGDFVFQTMSEIISVNIKDNYISLVTLIHGSGTRPLTIILRVYDDNSCTPSFE